ncbi:MAG: hypothetical protein WAQ08_16155 [Aquabacterium sp.]|uniref:hypothetical protein n=1 Tax=Aquabacterium sp. TaxID=1872578 RepID=UPI003BAEEB71
MTVRVAYFSNETFIVSQVLTGPDLGAFPLPDPGNQSALLLNDELEMPLYFDGTEFQPLPAQPSDDHVWEPLSLSWVTNIYAAGEARGNLAMAESEYFYARGFYFEIDSDWRRVRCDERNSNRVRDAALLALQTAPGDPYAANVYADDWPRAVTREQALAMQAAMTAHSKAVDTEILRMMNESNAVYALAETDLVAGLAAMQAIMWTYIPTAPD